jgi:hypothetical protein
MQYIERTGLIARFRCSKCGNEITGLLEPQQQFPDDPYVIVTARLSGSPAELSVLRRLLPELQDRSISDLMRKARRDGTLDLGVFRSSKADELAKSLAEYGVTMNFNRSPLP